MSDSLDIPGSLPQIDGGDSSASQPPTDGGSPAPPAPSTVQDSSPEENSGDTSPPAPPQSPESTESPSPAKQPTPASPPPSSPPPSPPTSPPPSPDPPETSQSAPSPTASEPPPSSPPPSSPPPAPSEKSPPPSASKSEPSPAPEKPSTPKPTSGSNRSPGTPPSPPFPLSPEVFTPPSPERGPNGPPAPPRSVTPPSKNDGGRDSGGSSSSQPSPTNPEVKSSKVPPSSNGKGEHGNGNDKGNDASKAIVGAILGAGLLLIILAIVLVARKKNKRKPTYPPQYMPPGKFPVKQDGFYHGQQQQPQSMGFSGPSNPSYGSQPPYSFGDSYVSSGGGNGYSGAPDSSVISGGKIHFNYEDLMEMTNGFSRENVIGEGGFGCVYKGCLADGRVVAIKQLKAGSGQGEREFRAEVEIISRVHHRYLVSLVGYCVSNVQRLLIYEFVPNNTLEHHLHSKGLPVLDWAKRLKIAIGSAKGLAYLHEDCHPKIIHRDIKSANILLDDDFEAQVADFGLARLNDSAETHVSTRVMGTFGYLAPEYASSGKLTDRSDVYSFGVVLLELITGRKPIDASRPLGDESLVEWARPLLLEALETGDLSLIVDERLGKHYVESEMIRMIETAAACVRHSGPKRPRMAQVVRALDSEDMGDLTNGIKYGQSVAFNIGQHNEELMKFRRMALAESGEFAGYSGEYGTSSEVSQGYTSGESETRAMNRPKRQYV